MADCVHHLRICPTCEGLEVIRLEAVTGVSDVTITWADGAVDSGPAQVFIGPVSTPCDSDDPRPTA